MVVRRRNRGQTFVEFAVGFVVFVILLFAVVDAGFWMYQQASYTYGLSEINWNISYKDALSASTVEERNKLIKGAICSQLNVNEDSVVVENAAIVPDHLYSTVDLGYSEDDPVNGIWSANERMTNLRFTADVKCRIVMPVPFLEFKHVDLRFDLDRIVPYEKQFEVSWYAPRY